METTLRVAFASNDMKHVNQHFGSTEGFVIYAIDREQATLLEVAQFDKFEHDGNEDKLTAKLALIEGCSAVYCQAVGASAIHQLTAKNIQPIKVSENYEIEALIKELQEELRLGPSKWLAKAIKRQQGNDESRFDQMEAEGWNE